MKDTLLPYDEDITKQNIISIFNSFKNKISQSIESAIEKLNQEETV